ncbi:MAG TPA: hypothetical protein VF622_11440 [Segetibacter sp.]|jgi:hypothetical protein
MEDEKQLSEHESLSIIQQMIDTAKQEQKDDGMGWIVWGWMLFFASVLTYINLQTRWFSTFFFWDAFGVLTFVLLGIEIARNFRIGRKAKVKTYSKAIFQTLNVGFFVCLMFIIIVMNMGVDPRKGFPLLMNLYGFWILIYGAILNFKPSMIGAGVMWVFAFSALFVETFSDVMILHAAGVLCGYIIPGHIANYKFKQLSGRSSNKAIGV